MLTLSPLPDPSKATYDDLKRVIVQIIAMTKLNHIYAMPEEIEDFGILFLQKRNIFPHEDPGYVFDVTFIPQTDETMPGHMHFVFLWNVQQREATVQVRIGTPLPSGFVAGYQTWEQGLQAILELVARSLDHVSRCPHSSAEAIRELLDSPIFPVSFSDRPTIAG